MTDLDAKRQARDALTQKVDTAVSFLPTAWTVVAIIFQPVFLALLLPLLPESIIIDFGLFYDPRNGPFRVE